MLTQQVRCAVLVLLLIGTLGACKRGPLSGRITIDGSTTVFPLSKAMAEAFRQSNPGVQLAIAFSGTGGGFTKFCAGQVDIEGASRPINATESEQCKAQHVQYIELPVAFDSLAVVVNAKNDFANCLTVQELKAIWEPPAEGKTNEWRQVRASFPAHPLALFGPGKNSGTFDYFTLAIVGTESSSRSDYAKSEDDLVTERGVAGDPNALGYFGYAYYAAYKDRLKVVAIDNGKGCVLPSPAAVADGTYQPLSRPLFLYVNQAAAARPEVNAFAHFYLAPENTRYVTKMGYVPLPDAALAAETVRFEKKATGSVLGGKGSVIGVPLTSFDDDERDQMRSALAQ